MKQPAAHSRLYPEEYFVAVGEGDRGATIVAPMRGLNCFSGACGDWSRALPESSRARAFAPHGNANCTWIGAKTCFCRNLVKPPEGPESP